ncbi:MAG: Flp pilus assembly protein CpaB [Negativicutes bacterium]|nr:Flp pilus assembly protein CpaB [Negativicutes bacterium]
MQGLLSTKGIVAIAAILSMLTSGLIYNYLKNASEGKLSLQQVVVAAKDIPERTVITADMVKLEEIPVALVPPGVLTQLEAVTGSVTSIPLRQGDQITDRKLIGKGKTAEFVGVIPPDKRALTIPVTNATGVAGFIKAGDFVDVIAIIQSQKSEKTASSILLQKLRVLAANHYDTRDAGVKDSKSLERVETITVAVTPDEAILLALAEETGKIHVTLRPVLPIPDTAVAKIVTSDDLIHISGDAGANVAPVFTPPAFGGQGVRVIRGSKDGTIRVK